MKGIDLAVIGAYFIVLPVMVWRLSRRRCGAEDFLSAHHDLPWWAICLSLVATETSTLTFISVPGVGFTNGMVFLGLAGGYLIGRTIVAIWFLPLYMRGAMTSAYEFLGDRFGDGMRRAASGAFLVTRLLAEGIRLLAGMLPLIWLFQHAGLSVGRLPILCVVMVFTLAYTLLGGLRAVVWSDTIQLCVYLFGAFLCVVLLAGQITPQGWSYAKAAGWLSPFHASGWRQSLVDPFTPLAALAGGAILSVASHGTDQLMVQRVLAARTLADARRALVGSAFLVALLFGLLSLIGVQLWIRDGGTSIARFDSHSPDEIFPHFMVSGLPGGLTGLLVAGVLSATMGSLSSTLNAMAGALLTDFGPVPARAISAVGRVLGMSGGLFAPRVATLFWAVMLIAVVMVSGVGQQSVVVLGLTIAGWSYGPTLGAFLFGMICPSARSRDATVGFGLSLLAMGGAMLLFQKWQWHVAFPWLVPLGIVLMFLFAGMSAGVDRLSVFCRTPACQKDR